MTVSFHVDQYEYLTEFSRLKEYDPYSVWEVIFNPTQETLDALKVDLSRYFDVIDLHSITKTLVVLSTVLMASVDFVRSRPGVLLYFTGLEFSRNKVYERVLRTRLHARLPGYEYTTTFAGVYWIYPNTISEEEVHWLETKQFRI